MALRYVVGDGLKTVSANSLIYEISGSVELPVLTNIGASIYNKDSISITTAKVTAKLSGTSQYKIVIKSFGSLGGTETTHIDQTITLGTKTIVNLPITTANIGSNRTVHVEVQQLTGTPSEDITITLL